MEIIYLFVVLLSKVFYYIKYQEISNPPFWCSLWHATQQRMRVILNPLLSLLTIWLQYEVFYRVFDITKHSVGKYATNCQFILLAGNCLIFTDIL
jgi:hypothetical protein